MKHDHWTNESTKDFLFRIAFDFVSQIEKRMEERKVSQTKLARLLGVSKGRVSHILNNPGNLTLEMMIRCARVLNMKLAVLAYDDNDPKNMHGPIHAEVFRICWELKGKPADMWAFDVATLPTPSPITSCDTLVGSKFEPLKPPIYFGDSRSESTKTLVASN